MLKGYEIAMFLFILSFSVSLMSEASLFGSAYPDLELSTNFSGNWTYTYDPVNNGYYIATDDGMMSTVNASGFQMTGLDEASILDVLIMFGRALSNATAFLPFFLQSLGIPDAIVVLITAPVWFAYISACVQIVRGVVFED